jgi:hypothetical protein
MKPKVFISHKNEDKQTAETIAARLYRGGLDVYIDSIDPQLNKDGPDLADHLRGKLEECTQLLAVISHITQASWWVPWEIGVATEKERFLASYISGGASVPEYLRKWPYMRSYSELDIYIQRSKTIQQGVDDRVLRGNTRAASRSTGFREFHRSLKYALGQ